MDKMSQLRSYSEMLKTTASQDILDIPIEALELSREVMNIIRNNRVYKGGQARQKITTVGDMLNTRLEGVEIMLSAGKMTPAAVGKLTFEIEQKLASLGLRFRDSEFTVGDVVLPISSFSTLTQKFIKKHCPKLKTIDDLALFNPKKYTRVVDTSDFGRICNELEEFIEAYGMKIEGCKRRYDRDYAFPLDKYKQYLTAETIKARCGKTITHEAMERRDTSNPNRFMSGLEDAEQLPLSSDIYAYDFNQTTLQALAENKFFTIEDIIKRGKELEGKISRENMHALRRAVARLDKVIEGQNYEVVNGQVVKYPSKPTAYAIPTAIPHFDAKALDEEGYAKFVSTRVADFGFDERIATPLENAGVETIDDVLRLSRADLLEIFSEVYNKIAYLSDCLYKYNLDLYKSRASLKLVEPSKILDLHADSASDEELTHLLKMDLREVGFTTLAAEQFERAGYKNLFDICQSTQQNIQARTGNFGLCVAARQVRAAYGLKSKSPSVPQRKSLLIDEEKEYKVNVKSLSVQDRERLMIAPLDEVGFSKKYAAEMGQVLGAHNLRELCLLSGAEISKAFTANYVNFTNRILENYGLSLTPSRAKKRAAMVKANPVDLGED